MTSKLSDTISLVRVVGLVSPAAPARVPWHSWMIGSGVGQADVLCFCWGSRTGRMWVGAGADHRVLLSRWERRCVGVALLGYAFPSIRTIAIRGVYQDLPCDPPVPLAEEVAAAFTRNVRRCVADELTIFSSVHNPFLWARLSELCGAPRTVPDAAAPKPSAQRSASPLPTQG
jgi:hypothetical protein